MTFQKELSCGMLYVNILRVGEDCQILLSGESRPHIGCTVLAVPRPSLSGDGHTSATSSVLNVTGHKDEAICRYLAEKAAAAYGCIVCCSGGFHVDHITEDQICELMSALDEVPLETYQKSQ